jgi:hypothetical protein
MINSDSGASSVLLRRLFPKSRSLRDWEMDPNIRPKEAEGEMDVTRQGVVAILEIDIRKIEISIQGGKKNSTASLEGRGMEEGNNSQGEKVFRSEEEWLELLTPEAYRVLRQNGTERPFTSPFHNPGAAESFACQGCGTVLFSGSHQFDSGCGGSCCLRAIGQLAWNDSCGSALWYV